MEKFTFFWSGPFSNWYPCSFTIDKIKFNCTEQHMMWCKAQLFNDPETAAKILASNNPKEQKGFGRQVKNFNVGKWAEICKKVVFVGNVAKYQQNDNLCKLLLATVGTTLVEASPYDKIWGIGLAANDKRAQDRSTWQGKNLLGEVLTNVRDHIIKLGD